MKVRYIGKTTMYLDYGLTYDVVSVESGWDYRIIDRWGEDYLFPIELFEIVDTEPDKPIPTDDEYWKKKEAA